MDIGEDSDFAAGFGGPGPEDFANGAAALAAALVREAGALAAAAAALRQAGAVTPGDPQGGPLSDIRRQRPVMAAAGEAALTAALLLEAATIIGPGAPPSAAAERIATAARRAGSLPAGLVPPLRAAALALGTDDGAARIAAATIAEGLAEALGRV
ncbi:hypothetical protein GCM10011504_39040 [Siccirubricoccus deserti]|uniref:Uncharacterized protein n=1 Tax=Siccirubricoccus deserti TaxID=2013562 RepID=A0A9X0UE26_9PROT|nr:hypothetical protein [Siccirubricoccus deserti]MBC4017112.1 hypothetical protein [Siccirubricoccus deserti]GGC56889.1 hypothetical protein GCM10011504_39040 [Siccirubricoccus deserti]